MNPEKTGIIRDDELEHHRALSGKSQMVKPTSEAATKDAIRHFADGIGDPNSLWRDEQYAGRTRHGCLVAPPTFLNAIAPGHYTRGLPSAAQFVAGCEWCCLARGHPS